MKMDRGRGGWLAAGVVAWLFCTLALFYWVQKRLGPANAAALGRTALDLLTAALIGAAGLALGSRLLRRLAPAALSGGDRLVLGAGLGLGALGLAAFGLGLVGVLSPWFWLVLLLAVVALLRRELVDAARTLRAVRLPGRGVRLYVAVTLLLALLTALTPPTDFDGLFYHLTGPSWSLGAGRVGPPPVDVPHLSFPGLMESLFSLAMLLRGDVAAKLLHWGFAPLLGGLAALIARRHAGGGRGWGAVVALYATPMVGVLAGWAYNDLALAFFQVAALYAVLNGLAGRGRRWFGVGGALAGLALGLKYTAFVCPLALVAMIAWEAARRRLPPGEALGCAAWFGGAALAVAAPWYVRNWLFVGNPVYPFAYALFGGQGWSEWHADWYAQAGTGLGGDVVKLLALPVTLTLGRHDMNYYDGRTGPLFLAALPVLLAVVLFDRRMPRGLAGLLFFSLVQYLAWVVGVTNSRPLFQSRLLLAGLVALCPALDYGYGALQQLDRPRFSVQRFVGLAVALVLALNVVTQALDVVSLRPLPVLAGEESRDGFLTRRLGAYYAAMQAVAALPDEASVRFFWEPRSFYAGRVVQPDPVLEGWSYLCHVHGADAGAIAAALRERGVTHLLLHQAGMEYVARETQEQLGPAEVAAWEALREGYLEVVWEIEAAYVLYEWR